MRSTRLLLVALTPLLVANAVMWLLYAKHPIVALAWLATLWASWRYLPKD